MKRFFKVLAVVLMLGVFAPAYAPDASETFMARGEVHYRCHYCGKTVASHEIPRAVKGRCNKSPDRKHHFGSCGRW
ncbi:MAG: hypothetical protein IJT02_09200 [Synergistaceae bacterium]|nr:hypothetical protein [Synergistaceae bacterium]